MKLRNLFFAALSVLAFAACTETPEPPYNPGGGTGNGGGSTVTGDNLLTNSSFETWEGGVPTGWGQTVTNATYSQSTEKNTGESAVLIEGNSEQNKRLASKSYTLSAGTYTLAAHLKQSGDSFGQFRLGYAKLTDGVVADTENDYIYLTSAAAVTANWKQTAVEFTLEAETELAFIVMNSRYGNGAPILVDDVILVTVNGAVVGGADDEPGSTELPEGTYIKESFAASFGSFTTQETVGSYPWEISTQYRCAKATGYKGSTNAAESWLISNSIDLSEETEAYISFDYVIAYESDDINNCHKVVFSNDYTGDVATATWIEINYSPTKSGKWTLENIGKIAIPAEMYGKNNVVVAFKYTSSTEKASTWEVANVIVAHGTAEAPSQPEEPETPDTPTGDATIFDFTSPEALTPSVTPSETPSSGVNVDGYTFTNGNVSITLTKGSASNPPRFWTRTGGDVELRTYKGSTITISVSEGTMSGIVFKGSQISAMTADSGEFGNGVWSGDAQSVTFSATDKVYITSLEVY